MEVECLALRDLISPMKNKVDEARGESEQKENICVERRRTTPLKSEPAATVLYGKKANPTPDLVHITPIKHPDPAHPHPEPWTPTANLKMLISAASPDIRDREMKKVLFRPIENEREMVAEPQEETEVEDPCQFDPVEEEAEENGETKPSRKQKSLGLLCQKFLALYPDYPASAEDINISLDEVATSLGVERRRIYDIVNVLESLMIVARMAKNWYVWHGRRRLASTLAELHELGRQQRYHLHMDQAREGRESCLREDTTTPSPEDGADAESGYAAASKRKDKSLRIMSQKFVMLFLVSKTQTVTLDVAAKILIEESQATASHSKYKTKVRRLYDIANVLTSLGLIKKVHVREERGRKPAFKWIGPTDFQTSNEDSLAVSLPVAHADRQLVEAHDARKQTLARHASFNVVPTSAANPRRINSAPSSPRRELTGQLPRPMDYSRRSASNSAVYRLQFGNTTDTQTVAGERSPNLSASPLLHSPGHAPPATPVHPEGPYGALQPPSSFSPHHRLAYLPSLSQPSVVMLYGGPAPQEGPDGTLQGQGSPEPGWQRGESVHGKRKSSDDDDEGRTMKRDKREWAEVEGSRTRGDEGQSEEGAGRWPDSPGSFPDPLGRPPRDDPAGSPGDGEGAKRNPSDHAQPSHYLYVPNSAGLNSLNFLLSAGQTPGSLALPPGSVPTLAYLLVPSNLPHYPLMANGLQATGTESRANHNFNMPTTMVSPGHFVVGAGHYAVAGLPEFGGSVPTPASPEQPRVYGSALVPLHSPLEPRQPVSIPQTEPLTPLTPKEIAAGGSRAFFQTPGTLGSVDKAPAVRRRGSAQRRLDIGHPAAS